MTQWATNPTVRKLVSQLSLPIKLPTLVRRQEQDPTLPLLGKKVLLTALEKDTIRQLAEGGASLMLVGKDAEVAAELARTYGRSVSTASNIEQALTDQADALVLEVGHPQALYAMLHPVLSKLASHCRVLLVTRASSPEADREAVLGFAKSFAREVGSKAITVNVIDIAKGANAAATIAWFAGDRGRYLTGQRIFLKGGEIGGLSLSGEKAIVTGAARGIGASISAVLARQGAEVTLVDLPSARDAATEVVHKIRASGGRAEFVAGDVTRDNVITAPAGILVNNAGITRDKTFAKMTEDKWNQVIAVNYEAAVKTTENWLAAGNKGSVIFLSSVVGISGNFGQTNYTLSKAALIGYVRSLKKDGVRANAIAPGFIDTVLTREVPFLNREVGKQLTCLLQAGEPEDIAEVVAFLASRASSPIEGQTIRVDGGMFFGA